jgi:hypothetical protein
VNAPLSFFFDLLFCLCLPMNSSLWATNKCLSATVCRNLWQFRQLESLLALHLRKTAEACRNPVVQGVVVNALQLKCWNYKIA